MKMSMSPAFLLTVLFVTLRLCGVIAWSWWWVFAPLWAPLVLFGVIVAAGVLIGFAFWEKFHKGMRS